MTSDSPLAMPDSTSSFAPSLTPAVTPALMPTARPGVQALVASQIREVANVGIGDPDILPFWFGEPDEVTPPFIRDAAADSLAKGETFYSSNYGIPELRAAIATYLSALHRPIPDSAIAVTASGMSALMLTVEALVGAGDRVVVVTPVWPNLTEIPKILGAEVVRVPLVFGPAGWTLDVDRLLAALTPSTRLVLINSPNNPTGWTITPEARHAILAHCRRQGTWILADDVYERLWYPDVPDSALPTRRSVADTPTPCAPSFLDLADPADRLVSTNSFSKAWSMTGFRLGWIVAPGPLMDDLGKLIEYNTSCSPVFVQRAGVAAIRAGEPSVAHAVARYRHARDHLLTELTALPGIEAVPPAGAMYAFFRVAGVTDSLAFCKALVREAKLGLAPGSAFGPEGNGFVRWCFAASEARLSDGVGRLAAYLAHHRPR